MRDPDFMFGISLFFIVMSCLLMALNLAITGYKVSSIVEILEKGCVLENE